MGHAGKEFRLGHGQVDLLAQPLVRQPVQTDAAGVAGIFHKAIDLDVVGNADKGNAGGRGKDQGVEADGTDGRHPPQQRDDQLDVLHAVQHGVRSGQPAAGRLAGSDVLGLLKGDEQGRQAVFFIGVGGRPRKDAVVVQPLPGPQGKGDIAAVGIEAAAAQQVAHPLVGGRGQAESGVGRQADIGAGDAHAFQFPQAAGVAQSDDVGVAVEDAAGQPAVEALVDVADAAAVHEHPAAQLMGGPDGGQVEIEGPAGGDVLDQAAAAVDEEAPPAHFTQEGAEVEGVNGPYPFVQHLGFFGLAGHHAEGRQTVDGAHGVENGF